MPNKKEHYLVYIVFGMNLIRVDIDRFFENYIQRYDLDIVSSLHTRYLRDVTLK